MILTNKLYSVSKVATSTYVQKVLQITPLSKTKHKLYCTVHICKILTKASNEYKVRITDILQVYIQGCSVLSNLYPYHHYQKQ
jgi:hypothetical protein